MANSRFGQPCQMLGNHCLEASQKEPKTTTSKQTNVDLLHGKPRRRRHHRMAVIVETDLPPRAQGDAEKMHHRHRRYPRP